MGYLDEMRQPPHTPQQQNFIQQGQQVREALQEPDFPSPEEQEQPPQTQSKYAMDYFIVEFRKALRRLQWLEKHIKAKKQIPEFLEDQKSPKPTYVILGEAEQIKIELEEMEDYLIQNNVPKETIEKIKSSALAEETGYTKIVVK